MIRMMVLYPRSEGTTFDFDYWSTKHMPMLSQIWPTLARWEADKGADDGPYHAVAHLYFDDQAAFMAAMTSPDAGKGAADLPNYTNITPVASINTIAAHS